MKIIEYMAWIGGVLYVGFLSVFAMDVFGEFDFGLEMVVALGMHLLPAMVYGIGLGIAKWRMRWGGWAWLGLGLLSVVVFRTYGDLVGFLLISLWPILVGVAFWVSGGRELKS